jgi:hypothetical protein
MIATGPLLPLSCPGQASNGGWRQLADLLNKVTAKAPEPAARCLSDTSKPGARASAESAERRVGRAQSRQSAESAGSM